MPGYHVSTYEVGRFKDGAWHCSHGDPAAQNWAGSRSTSPGMRFWSCDRSIHSKDECRFFLWEDHIEDAIKHHNIPEEIAIHIRQTPTKRKRDRDIREFYPRTPKTPRTPRTRAAGAETPGTDSPTARLGGRSIGGPSNGGPSNGGPSNSMRDLSPSPMPRTASRPQSELVVLPPRLPPLPPALPQPPSTASLPQPGFVVAPPVLPSLPPAQPHPLMVQQGLAVLPPPLPPAQPQTPRTPPSKGKERAPYPGPVPFALTPSPGRRRLSSPELRAYNSAIKALAADKVKLSLKGQNALRDIIKEESYWIE